MIGFMSAQYHGYLVEDKLLRLKREIADPSLVSGRNWSDTLTTLSGTNFITGVKKKITYRGDEMTSVTLFFSIFGQMF